LDLWPLLLASKLLSLESEILWKRQARKKSPPQMKINFSQSFFQQSAMLSEDSEGKMLWFGAFWRDDVPLTVSLHYRKILR